MKEFERERARLAREQEIAVQRERSCHANISTVAESSRAWMERGERALGLNVDKDVRLPFIHTYYIAQRHRHRVLHRESPNFEEKALDMYRQVLRGGWQNLERSSRHQNQIKKSREKKEATFFKGGFAFFYFFFLNLF